MEDMHGVVVLARLRVFACLPAVSASIGLGDGTRLCSSNKRLHVGNRCNMQLHDRYICSSLEFIGFCNVDEAM